MTDLLDPVDGRNPTSESADAIKAMAGELPVNDGAVEIPVRISPVGPDRGSLLPPQVEQPRTDPEALSKLKAEISSEIPTEAPVESLAEQLIERQNSPLLEAQTPNREFIKEATNALSGARNLGELVDLVQNRKVDVSIAESEDGWFKPVPGDHKSELFMNILEQARQQLEKRGNIEKAKDGVSRAFDILGDVRQVSRERDELRKDAAAESLEERRQRSKEVKDRMADKALRDKEAADEASLAALKEEKAKDEALIGPGGFEEFVEQEISKAVEPIKEQIRQLQRLQSRLMAATDRMPLHDRKELEAQNAHELDALYKKAASERKKVIEKTALDRKNLTKSLREQASSIDAFENDIKSDTHIYKPDDDMHPEMAALIAGANGALVGASKDPIKFDEYDIDNGKKQHPTRMQRLVYSTSHPNVFIVEDWDKTSGKLKRQALVKSASVLVPAKENGVGRLRRGRNKIELSNKVYEKLGPIESSDVKKDSDTTTGDGYSSYVRNLSRAGGVGLTKAKELADPTRPKNKRTQSFIEMLTKNITTPAKKA